jgi:hypothetical protein
MHYAQAALALAYARLASDERTGGEQATQKRPEGADAHVVWHGLRLRRARESMYADRMDNESK